ncbi:uncharacterized protein BX663DRAFT_501128 [Cokeromyces recurvatus]|uniref:uncharacterized protein n=1 Tax=Cokeromyces recurvatus TaxID=90255 RepID=UPI00221FE659|nr:uncharacterized protein BX663DRAFT_501128 [Cokeromyces recurvatus]KAI7904949.1 hypothetical protein BX663DRAFT_501128 [Cokeromyces recurvatus]
MYVFEAIELCYVMFLPPYSLELNLIKQFWAIVERRMKYLSGRICYACNNTPVKNLESF